MHNKDCDALQELGANFNVGEIPEDMKAEAEEWHEKLLETAVEVDDAALEAYFEGEVRTFCAAQFALLLRWTFATVCGFNEESSWNEYALPVKGGCQLDALPRGLL